MWADGATVVAVRPQRCTPADFAMASETARFFDVGDYLQEFVVDNVEAIKLQLVCPHLFRFRRHAELRLLAALICRQNLLST